MRAQDTTAAAPAHAVEPARACIYNTLYTHCCMSSRRRRRSPSSPGGTRELGGKGGTCGGGFLYWFLNNNRGKSSSSSESHNNNNSNNGHPHKRPRPLPARRSVPNSLVTPPLPLFRPLPPKRNVRTRRSRSAITFPDRFENVYIDLPPRK